MSTRSPKNITLAQKTSMCYDDRILIKRGYIMELREYLLEQRKKDPRFKHHEFAKKIGLASTNLSAIAHYRITPSPQLSMKIEDETKGAVIWSELIRTSLERRGKLKRKEREAK